VLSEAWSSEGVGVARGLAFIAALPSSKRPSPRAAKAVIQDISRIQDSRGLWDSWKERRRMSAQAAMVNRHCRCCTDSPGGELVWPRGHQFENGLTKKVGLRLGPLGWPMMTHADAIHLETFYLSMYEGHFGATNSPKPSWTV
jgi:hypothetical protein